MPPSLWAVRTEKWVGDSFGDFSQGEARGVAIDSDGFLKIGPEIRKTTSLPAEVVWTAVRHSPMGEAGSKGALYVAAGNEGQVFKVGGDGKAAEFFKTKELQVSALAVDSAGNLYAGSMPDGKVYRIDPAGISSVFFDPKEKYIWALQFDGEGNLFVATGDKGRLHRVNRSGKGTVFYDSDETHLRSLLLDGHRRLWVGSDGNGLVYRFDRIEKSEGNPFVAYDSGLREIKVLAASPGPDDSIFVGAMGDGKSAVPSFPSGFPKSDTPSAIASAITSAQKISGAADGTLQAGEVPAKPTEDDKPGAGEIVRILPDGSMERWWTDHEDVFSLAVPEAGKVWAGTGRKGKLIELTGSREFSILSQLEAKTITALLPDGRPLLAGGGQGWLAATSNSGAIWSVSAAPGRRGFYESRVFDAHGSSVWSVLKLVLAPGLGQIAVSTRSGNTAKPDKVWSEWVPLDRNSRIQSPSAQFIQYKVALEAPQKSGEKVLMVDSARLFYQPHNRPPQIIRVNILPANIELARMPKPETPLPPILPSFSISSESRSAKGGGLDVVEEAFAAFGRGTAIQQVRKLGWRSATWQAHDPNGDELRYDVLYRADGSDEWKSLKKDLDDQFASWDAATWLDGDYYLKVIASDLVANHEDEARSDRQISGLFTVDNIAPVIEADVSPATVKKGFISFTIKDTTSVVDEAEISVDGGDWRPFPPVNGIYDSKSNEFKLSIEKLKPGDHHAVIRASDSANNVASQTVKFRK